MYRVYRGSKNDPKDYRVFIILSRQTSIDSKFSTITCAPVYSSYDGLSTQVQIGTDEGLKQESSIYCDELVSIPKGRLTDFIGTLPTEKLEALKTALRIALDIED